MVMFTRKKRRAMRAVTVTPANGSLSNGYNNGFGYPELAANGVQVTWDRPIDSLATPAFSDTLGASWVGDASNSGSTSTIPAEITWNTRIPPDPADFTTFTCSTYAADGVTTGAVTWRFEIIAPV